MSIFNKKFRECNGKRKVKNVKFLEACCENSSLFKTIDVYVLTQKIKKKMSTRLPRGTLSNPRELETISEVFLQS